jgi:transposase
MPDQEAFGKKWRHQLMQYMGSGEIRLELRYEYDHFVYLEKQAEHLGQEISGYTMKHWKPEYMLIQSITGFGPALSCYIIAHILPITRFSSKRKLRRYAGVVPSVS